MYRYHNNILVKLNLSFFSLAIVFMRNLYYLYLLDAHYGKLFGIAFQDIALILAIVWGSYYWIKMIKLPCPRFRYKNWILSFFVLAFFSSLQATLLFGQSFVRGFAPQRWILVWAFMYFPIRKLMYYQKITFNQLLNLLVSVGIIQIILFFLQYFSKDTVVFMHVTEGYRNGRIRYYYSPILLDWLFMLSLDKFVGSKGIKKIVSIGCLGVILFDTMVIQQFRLTTMGLIICTGLFVILVKCKRDWKILYLFLGIVAFSCLLGTSMVQNVLNTVITGTYDGGMRIRSAGRKLYFATIFRHPLFGGGYPSSFYQPAANAAGMNNLIYLYDNGLFGFMYIYGLIGIVWFVTFWRRLILDGLYIQKRTCKLAYFMFPIFFIITCINELHWYWEYGFVVFSMYIGLMETKMSSEGIKIESHPH